MIKLATPGYQNNVLMNQVLPHTPERTIDFRGLNRLPVIQDGEMSDMLNLCSDEYPFLAPRRPRADLPLPEGALRPIRLFRRYGKLGMIAVAVDLEDETQECVALFYDGERVTAAEGQLSTDTRPVAINTKMCFFPEKKYIEIINRASGPEIGAFGSLEAAADSVTATVALSNMDGRMTFQTAPGFKADDAVTFSGSLTYDGTTTAFSTSAVITDTESDGTVLVFPTEIFIDMIAAGKTSGTFSGDITRTLPSGLDHVVEWNNRLWGVSNEDNTIYACKLGDPTNWNYYQGTSMDSYFAQQGTDEAYTGVGCYSGHLIFFKPNSMTRIYGTAPANYQIDNAECYGVEKGSRESVVTINDAVFYKSSIGIMAYQGGLPVCISDKLAFKFSHVVGGTEGQKYYASFVMDDMAVVMVYDIAKGVWHRQECPRLYDTVTIDNHLYCTTVSKDQMLCGEDVLCGTDIFVQDPYAESAGCIINPETPTEKYTDIRWHAVFGPFDEYVEEKKIYQKIAVRYILKELLSNIDIYIKTSRFGNLDMEEWEHVHHFGPTDADIDSVPEYMIDDLNRQHDANGDFAPIVPRRCDRYWIKIEGRGNCQIKSLTRRVRRGTLGRL